MTFVPSKDSDQPGYLHSLIRVFTVHALWIAKDSRLLHTDNVCPGWSESSLGAQAILLVLSCCSTFMEENSGFSRTLN